MISPASLPFAYLVIPLVLVIPAKAGIQSKSTLGTRHGRKNFKSSTRHHCIPASAEIMTDRKTNPPPRLPVSVVHLPFLPATPRGAE